LSSSVTVTVPLTALGVGRGDGDGGGELIRPGPLDAVPAYAAVGFGSTGADVSGELTASSLGSGATDAFWTGVGVSGGAPTVSCWWLLPPPQAAAIDRATAVSASLMTM
jgi:hypothetical protein